MFNLSKLWGSLQSCVSLNIEGDGQIGTHCHSFVRFCIRNSRKSCIFAETNERTKAMEQIKQNKFQEVNESYTMLEAITEAQRCLNCKVPQCKKGCPISNDIPDWVHELSKGNLGNAISIIRGKSNLPAVCGRVCAHEKQCEGNCVLGKKGQALNIGKLERFVADLTRRIN